MNAANSLDENPKIYFDVVFKEETGVNATTFELIENSILIITI